MSFCKFNRKNLEKLTAFSFAAVACATLSIAGLGPVMAQGMPDNGDGTTTAAHESGAKGLFFEQLDKPAESLNTGLRYWIEMKRNGSMTRVSNKTQFRSGDSIRFHVRSNINGYAYILLSSGSRGEQSVLFPDEKAGEKNRVERGREYVLPGDGALTFDENPGTEKLTLLLSRTPIDAQAYLAKPAGEKELTLIASAETGSKDLVPARIYVAHSAPHSDGPPPSVVAAANRKGPEKTETTTTTTTTTKVAKKVEKKASKPVVVATKPETTTTTTTTTKETPAKRPLIHRTTLAAANSGTNPKDDEGTTTVVSEKSNGVLHVDVDLEHI